MLDAWKQFVDGQPLESEPSKAILESWERCKAFHVESARARLRRVPLQELNDRIARGKPLVDAAKKHLVWALACLEPLQPVIVILTDRDGIVLHSVGTDPDVMAAFGLLPGYDWSEQAMGTNGIGTALSFGAAVAVVGAEHYTQTWHNNTCVGAPVRGPDGEIWGAVDISTTAADGDPARLVLVAFLSHIIGLELGGTAERPYVTAELLERASAPGSSGKRVELEEGARALALLERDLVLTAHKQPADESARTEPTDIDAILRGAVAGLREASYVARVLPERVDLAAPQLFQRSLRHLITMLHRSGGAPTEVTASSVDSSLVVHVEACAGMKGPANNLDRAGVALGEWLARQLLAVSDATLERDEASGRVRYTVRLSSRPSTN